MEYVINTVLSTDVIDGDDMGMVEGRSCARFMQEPLAVLCGGLIGAQHLDRNGPGEPTVSCPVYFTHSAVCTFVSYLWAPLTPKLSIALASLSWQSNTVSSFVICRRSFTILDKFSSFA